MNLELLGVAVLVVSCILFAIYVYSVIDVYRENVKRERELTERMERIIRTKIIE